MDEHDKVIDKIFRFLYINKNKGSCLIDYNKLIPDNEITLLEFHELIKYMKKQGWIEITDSTSRLNMVSFKLKGIELMDRYGSYPSFLESGKSKYPKLQKTLNSASVKLISLIAAILSIIAMISGC